MQGGADRADALRKHAVEHRGPVRGSQICVLACLLPKPLIKSIYCSKINSLNVNYTKFCSINDRAFTYNEFGRHLMSAQRAYANRPAEFSEVIDKELDKFFERSILQYREDNLELENEDFANILKAL